MSFLSLFGKRKPPKACPSCGETALWRVLLEDGPIGQIAHPDTTQTFGPREAKAPGTGHGIPYGWGKKTTYRCGKCGYEAQY